MTEKHYGARELAGVPGMPGTVSAVIRRSAREGWPFRTRPGRGGGREYAVSSLPKETRIFLAKQATGAGDQLLPVPSSGTLPEVVVLEPEIVDAVPRCRSLTVSNAPLSLTPAMEEKLTMRAAILSLYRTALESAEWGGRMHARLQFEMAYNSGLAWPDLYQQLGPLSWKTIESWSMKVRQHGGDRRAIADRRGQHRRGACTLSEEQTNILLKCALRPNKPRISEAIRITKAILAQAGIHDETSDATYRRWLMQWKQHNYDVWVWIREGAKQWNDKCAMYIERDMSRLQVGDVIVADGHNLNFEILNPWTGKAQTHMTLILFYDMASSYPLGWEIMPTEHTAAISSALRRAIIALGKYPRLAYLDNGRAFKARFFKGSDLNGQDGIYDRIGCQVTHAWPYHGQSKTVERFFGTFAELERLIPSYTGNSIEAKPPRMMRGEKVHRQIHEKQFGGRVLTIDEAHQLIAAWFDEYALRPQRGHLDGRCPREVFEAGRGTGVDRTELSWLMMQIEVRSIGRNGITFRGQNYYHPALAGRRHRVYIRYDLQDLSSLLVLDEENNLICEARPMALVHPAAKLGTEEDQEALRLHIEAKRHQEKQAVSTAKHLLVNEVLPEHRRQLEMIAGPGESHEASKKNNIARIAPPVSPEEREREVAKAFAEQDKFEERLRREQDDRIAALPEGDRYEKLMEMELRGEPLNQGQRSFLRAYEQGAEYAKNEDFWTSRRSALETLYPAAAGTAAG